MVQRSLSPFGGTFGADPYLSLQREMNRLFEDAWGRQGSADMGRTSQQGAAIEARMNVSETETELRVTAELPGVREEDVDVTLEGDVLTIRGEKKFEQERGAEKENFHFVERMYGSFQRSLQLPFMVKPEDVRAEFHNGVLSLTLPKGEQQQRRKIPVMGRSQQRLAPDEMAPERGDGAGAERQAPAAGETPAHH